MCLARGIAFAEGLHKFVARTSNINHAKACQTVAEHLLFGFPAKIEKSVKRGPEESLANYSTQCRKTTLRSHKKCLYFASVESEETVRPPIMATTIENTHCGLYNTHQHDYS
ncbi:hypothetical protein BU25DRAFT_35179 [Macroventuria anomochaeta]|uniref:Uncharacterized protein n=1 Tax=Macroventuria anomochaeta TaxID=301207 RepID=A0ACB6S5J5_9PLEO|nr:uncharacterized protein BU25DRAFT_35179 [Macroventuria anomochaeta]KAF2628402.1 hypothetical protein BU25DRAFT_35179 [Macroventuria anomochaeta]